MGRMPACATARPAESAKASQEIRPSLHCGKGLGAQNRKRAPPNTAWPSS